MMYDVAIVGAGPAGATLARLIGKRYRVLLVDRRALDVPPVPERAGKCCGGLLSANAQQALAELGLVAPASIMTDAQPTAVRVIDADNRLECSHPRPYINCHRELLDRWLVSLVPAEVDVRCGASVQKVSVDDTGITLQLAEDGRRHTERARLVVGADGAHSLLRRKLFPRALPSRMYLAVQGWYEMARPLPEHVAIFDRAVTDFYGWAVPKDGLLAIGAALAPHADPHGHFALLLARLAAYGVTPGKLRWREGAMIQRPMRRQDICTGNGPVALLGEAAGWISPSSAEGFSYAFRSAMAMAAAMEEGLTNVVERYTALTQPLRRIIAHEQLKCVGMFTPWLRRLALRAEGAVTMPIATPASHRLQRISINLATGSSVAVELK